LLCAWCGAPTRVTFFFMSYLSSTFEGSSPTLFSSIEDRSFKISLHLPPLLFSLLFFSSLRFVAEVVQLLTIVPRRKSSPSLTSAVAFARLIVPQKDPSCLRPSLFFLFYSSFSFPMCVSLIPAPQVRGLVLETSCQGLPAYPAALVSLEARLSFFF